MNTMLTCSGVAPIAVRTSDMQAGAAQTATPLVSIVIPAYNAASTIGETLDSVLSQTYANIEVIVVNDGSSDDTAAVLAGFGKRIRTILQANSGLAGARNAGLNAASGDFIALMDADDICRRDRIAIQIKLLQENEDVGLCASDFSAFNSEGLISESHLERYYSIVHRTPAGIAGLLPERRSLAVLADPSAPSRQPALINFWVGDIYRQLIWGNFLHPPTITFRRGLLQTAGLMDRRIRNLCDYDWLIRVSRLAKVALVPLPLLRYRLSAGQMSGDHNTLQVKQDLIEILTRRKASDSTFYDEHRKALDKRLASAQYSVAEHLADADKPGGWSSLLAGLRTSPEFGIAFRVMGKLILPRAARRGASWLLHQAGTRKKSGFTSREYKPVLFGALSFLPFVHNAQKTGDRWSASALADADDSQRPRKLATYCYGVWIKHLTLLTQAGMPLPTAIAEIGPGDSLGVGIAALLSGVKLYHAYDTASNGTPAGDLPIVRELAAMFARRDPRPTKGWPDFDRYLGTGLFPRTILPDSILESSLSEAHVSDVEKAFVSARTGASGFVRYIAPWTSEVSAQVQYDLILSHSVLQYVDDLDQQFRTYATMLRPGGWMSHQVDLSSLGITQSWNGHLAYGRRLWRIVRGHRDFGPNRLLPAHYLKRLRDCGFEVIQLERLQRHDGLRRSQLASEFRQFSDDEVNCQGLFIIARLAGKHS